MRNNVLLLVMFFLVLSSCKDEDKIGLTNPQKKWVFYDSNKKFDNDSVKFMTYVKFYEDGKCTNFFFNGAQYNSSGKWKFTNRDSILKIGENRFSILRVYNDSLIMKDLKFNREVQLLNWNVLKK